MQDPDLQIFRNNRVDYRLLSGGCKKEGHPFTKDFAKKKGNNAIPFFFFSLFLLYL